MSYMQMCIPIFVPPDAPPFAPSARIVFWTLAFLASSWMGIFSKVDCYTDLSTNWKVIIGCLLGIALAILGFVVLRLEKIHTNIQRIRLGVYGDLAINIVTLGTGIYLGIHQKHTTRYSHPIFPLCMAFMNLSLCELLKPATDFGLINGFAILAWANCFQLKLRVDHKLVHSVLALRIITVVGACAVIVLGSVLKHRRTYNTRLDCTNATEEHGTLRCQNGRNWFWCAPADHNN